jgi:hypothetical protein
MLSPGAAGAAGAPDSGVIVAVMQSAALAGGLPLATAGSLCQMVNSVTGVPYPLPIPASGVSTGLTIAGQGLVRMGDHIPAGSGVLSVLGPPAAPWITDGNAP